MAKPKQNISKSRPIEDLKNHLVTRVGNGGHASHAYSHNELFNLYCVASTQMKLERIYTAGDLDLAISDLIEEGKLVDMGSGWYGPPRPKMPERDERTD